MRHMALCYGFPPPIKAFEGRLCTGTTVLEFFVHAKFGCIPDAVLSSDFEILPALECKHRIHTIRCIAYPCIPTTPSKP